MKNKLTQLRLSSCSKRIGSFSLPRSFARSPGLKNTSKRTRLDLRPPSRKVSIGSSSKSISFSPVMAHCTEIIARDLQLRHGNETSQPKAHSAVRPQFHAGPVESHCSLPGKV